MKLAVVILAVGKGARMCSRLPKVLHRLAGRSLVEYSVDLAFRLSPEPPVLIVGHGAGQVRAKVGDRARFVEQAEGTGHAVLQAEQALADRADIVLVYAADMPLLTTDTLRSLVAAHGQHQGPITLLTVLADDPGGFGRIVRGSEDKVLGVVEEVEATPEQKAIRELNAGVYCFDATWLWPALKRLTPSPVKGEYHLADAVALAVRGGHLVDAVTTEDRSETMGVNTRVHLAEAERVLRGRINKALMMAGVTLIDPEAAYVQPGVQVGRDSTLWPGVHLLGETHIGAGCEIGPGAVLADVQLGDGCKVGAHAVLTGVVATAGAVFLAGVVKSIQRE